MTDHLNNRFLLDVAHVLVVLFYLPFCCVTSPADVQTLKLVSVIYRHGDRSPIKSYKSSIHNVTNFWKDGPGQLSEKGAEGEYELGVYLRNRYNGFLPARYNLNDIYVRSTNIDRALMSASSVLAAIYPHQGATPPFQPVPVHTVPEDTDFMLENRKCEDRDKIMEARKNSTVVQNFFRDYKNEIKDLEAKTGENITIDNIGYIIDSLHIESVYNVAPTWLTPELLKILREKIQPLLFYNSFCGDKLCRLSAGGRLVRKYIVDMEASLTPGTYTARPIKFYMYSAHDSTVASVLCTLNLFNNISVPYGAAVMVELHEVNTTHVVRVFYKNQTYNSDQQVQLLVPGCELDCPLDKFKILMENTTAKTPSGECVVNTNLTFDFFAHYDSTTILLVVLITEVGCLLLVLLCSLCTVRRCCRQKVKHRTYGRLRVETHPEEVPMISPGGGSDDEE